MDTDIVILVILFFIALGYILQKDGNEKTVHPTLVEIKDKLSILEPEKVKELEFFVDNRAYTLNKKKIFICLKNDKGKVFNMNTLMYVALHELAHAKYIGDSRDHNPAYMKIFDNLLERAEKAGIYNPSIPVDDDYCK